MESLASFADVPPKQYRLYFYYAFMFKYRFACRYTISLLLQRMIYIASWVTLVSLKANSVCIQLLKIDS